MRDETRGCATWLLTATALPLQPLDNAQFAKRDLATTAFHGRMLTSDFEPPK